MELNNDATRVMTTEGNLHFLLLIEMCIGFE